MCLYMGPDVTPEQTGVFAYPGSAIPMRVFLNRVTPRFDLPRAWPPDGTPVAGDWEYAVQYKTPDGWEYSRESWDCRWQESEAVQEVRALRDHPGEETRIVRRLVSQPEVMEP